MRAWILLLIIAVSACDSAPAPVDAPPADQTTAPSSEPEAPALPTEEHALLNTLPDLLPASVEVVVATANPRELSKQLGGVAPSASAIGERPPELADIHPDRLALYGIDSTRPAGLFSGSGGFAMAGSWGVFGYLSDRDEIVQRLDAREQASGEEQEDAEVKRYILGTGQHRLTIAGDLAIVTHHFPIARPNKLATNAAFKKLSAALDFGALVTAYVAGDAPVMVGMGTTEAGFAIRAVSTDEARARRVTERWFEHLYDLDLDIQPGGILAAMMYGSPTEEQLKKNKKLRKAHDAIEELNKQIDELEQAPMARRTAAATAAFEGLETERVAHDRSDELHVVTRLVNAPADFAPTLVAALIELDFTEDELAELKKLRKKRDKLRDDVSRMSSPLFAVFGDAKFDSSIENGLGGLIGSELGDTAGPGGLGMRGTGLGGGGTGEGIGMGSIGFIGRGGGGVGRTPVKRPTATLASASDPRLREHAKKRVARVRNCYTREIDSGNEFSGTVTSSVSIADGRVSVGSSSGGSASLNACVGQALAGAIDTEAAASGTVAFRLEKK